MAGDEEERKDALPGFISYQHPQQRVYMTTAVLYRQFLRTINAVARDTPQRLNLVRLFRPQLRKLLQNPLVDLLEAQATSELLLQPRVCRY